MARLGEQDLGDRLRPNRQRAARIRDKDVVRVDTRVGLIKNLTRKESYRIEKYPPFMQKIFAAGGLIESIRKKKEK